MDRTLAWFEELRAQHAAVGAQARTLAAGCERLVAEKERLSEFASALRAKLGVFEQLEMLAGQLHAASASPGAAVEVLPALLRDIDAALAFCAAHPQYADAQPFALRFRQLQARALSALRGTVGALLRRAVAASAQALAPDLEGDGDATGALYVRFRATALELRPLLEQARGRCAQGAPEYLGLMEDVRALYSEARVRLLGEHVAARARRVAEAAGGDACALARAASSLLLQLASDEHALSAHLLGDAQPQHLSPLLDQLAVPLYDRLRLASLHLRDLESLAELVDVLRREVLGEAAPRRGECVAAALPTLQRALADAQERLAFRAHTFLRHTVAAYLPSPEDAGTLSRTAAAAAAGAPPQLYHPVSAALSTLSRLYGALEADTFGGLAQEAVAAAVAAVAAAAATISQPARGASSLDANLFVASQLLALREQIAPFDTDFVVTQRALEFSNMRGLVRRILSGDAPLEALGALTQPRTVEAQLDGRKELERALKTSCEAFILAVTKAAIEPLLGFLAKANAVRGGAEAAAAARAPFKTLAFAAPPRLAELLSKTNSSLVEALRDATARTRLYLPAGQVAAVLFRPIKANIAEAHSQLAQLLEAEYTAQEVAATGIMEPEALRALLDTTCDV